jgi:hypothetical protein
VTSAFTHCLEELDARCGKIEEKIADIKKEQINVESSLRQRLTFATQAFEAERIEYQTMFEHLELLKWEVRGLFQILAVSDEEST